MSGLKEGPRKRAKNASGVQKRGDLDKLSVCCGRLILVVFGRVVF